MSDVRGGQRLTATAIAVAVSATLAGVSASMWAVHADQRSLLTAALNAGVATAFVLAGAVVSAARPGNRVGWVMLAGGTLWALGDGAVDVAHHGIVAAPGSIAGVAAFAVSGSAIRSVGWYLVTGALPVLFPDGRSLGGRWRWLNYALVVVVCAAVIDPLTDKQADLMGFGAWQNPIGLHRPWDIFSGLALLAHVPLSLLVIVGALAQLVARFRRGSALARQQVLLFALAITIPIFAVPLAFAAGAGNWAFAAAAMPLPIVIGFAVLAQGLYDLRTAANRTLVWLTLSAVVAAIYGLVIVGVAAVMHVHRGAAWLPWAAAAVVAVSFAPLRDVLQRTVNRVTFGRWDEPYDVLAALGQRLEATAEVGRLLDDVVAELHGLGLQSVGILDAADGLIAGDIVREEDSAADVDELALSAYGKRVGTLRYRGAELPMRPRDRRLLEDLTGHLGGVLHARSLTRELKRALERVVVAREEERRRLRRDLHDGLGPALAGHLLRLDVVAAKLAPEHAAAADVATLREDLRATVTEVRRVVEGLRPPALDELGLAGALTQAATRLSSGTPLRIDVDVQDLPPLPAAMEVAVYRVTTEAVTNVVRHANATSCDVRIELDGNCLRVTVADNGRGFDAAVARSGHGLQTMRERAEELGGRLRASSANGTVVTAELPVLVAQRPVPPPAQLSAEARS